MPDDLRAKLIVTDTGPLITLAAVSSLDYLLSPASPVYIPDAVLYEATVKSTALGAEGILIPLTTMDFLAGLETVGRINSADEVYRIAERGGRQASRKRVLGTSTRRLAPPSRAC